MISIIPGILSILLLFWPHSVEAQTEVTWPQRAAIISSVENACSSAATERFEKTIAQLLEASNQARSLEDYLMAAAISNIIGETYERQGSYQNALMQYEQGLQAIATRQAGVSVDIKKALEDLRGSEKSYPASQGTPISTDLYRGEIADLRKTLGLPAERGEGEIAVSLAMNAANMYLRQNQFVQADGLYREALDIARHSGLVLRQRQIYANLAWAAIKENRFEKAEDLLLAALKEERERLDAVELRRAFLAVGVNAREMGNTAKAISELKRAVILYDRAADLRGQSQALSHLATAYLQQRELEEAKILYLQALRLNEGTGDGTTTCHANGGLAKTYYQLDQLDAAAEHYSRFAQCAEDVSKPWFTDQGKVGVLEDYATFFREYSDVTLQLAQKTGDFTHARKVIENGRARALTSLLEARQSRPPLKPGTLPACLDSCPPDRPSQEAAGILSNIAVQMAPAVGSQAEESHFERKIPRVNPPPATFLETFVFDDRTAIFVRKPDGSVKGSVAAIKAEALEKLIASYSRALEVDVPRGVIIASTAPESKTAGSAQPSKEKEISQQLFRLLVEPVKRLLPLDPSQTLVIVPDQSLWFLPFAALRDENNAFFGDQHVLTYAISEAVWKSVATRARTADHHRVSAWVAGNPDMPPTVKRCGSLFQLDSLPGAEVEARTIAGLLGEERAQLFTRSQADRLRLDAWHSDFSVLHFATHGVACPSDPLSSFFVLKELARDDLIFDPTSRTLSLPADARLPVTLVDSLLDIQTPPPQPRDLRYAGLLDARTIINEFNLNADLVTLSACQTGLGQLSGEGMIGLTRAFLAAGSRSLMVSLWRVDDRSTKDLMVHFYRAYLEHGNKGLALQSAMAETRKQYPEPKYWAAFTLVGMAE